MWFCQAGAVFEVRTLLHTELGDCDLAWQLALLELRGMFVS